MMKNALLALFFLLFVLCSKATEDVVVLDVEKNPLRPGKPYHIRDAKNCERAISLDLIGNQTCPISVVMAISHVVGPPDKRHIPGSFHIKKAKDEIDAYNLVFVLHEVDEHVVSTQSFNNKEDLSVLKLCSEEGLKVKFYPVGAY
ncbi:hypothetical protein K1719_041267 [Acacia pycnantha]|nr:hypothetical protein K1719_041267 [Acacia pycnantha]